jgi:hypothetical protein
MKKLVILVVLGLGVLGVSARTSWASNAAIVIPFQKHNVGPGHYVGTAGNDGTIDMQLSNSSTTGNVQHFTALVMVTADGHSLTAVLNGRFNFTTGRTILNGTVIDGWLAGAQVHEMGQLVALNPLTFTGTVQLMPGSAN